MTAVRVGSKEYGVKKLEVGVGRVGSQFILLIEVEKINYKHPPSFNCNLLI